jgi:hypothetical protein
VSKLVDIIYDEFDYDDNESISFKEAQPFIKKFLGLQSKDTKAFKKIF